MDLIWATWPKSCMKKRYLKVLDRHHVHFVVHDVDDRIHLTSNGSLAHRCNPHSCNSSSPHAFRVRTGQRCKLFHLVSAQLLQVLGATFSGMASRNSDVQCLAWCLKKIVSVAPMPLEDIRIVAGKHHHCNLKDPRCH